MHTIKIVLVGSLLGPRNISESIHTLDQLALKH